VVDQQRRALVVGGGVIGLTSAFRLARAGFAVTLFDPSPGRGATWAAAGMLAPSAEVAPGEEANYEIQRDARAAWRVLARELEEMTGDAVDLHDSGSLLVGYDASDRRLIDQYEGVAATFGVDARRVDRASEPAYFEGVTGRISEGLFLREDSWLDPDQAVSVLTRANGLLGVEIVRETVTAAKVAGENVEVMTRDTAYRADVGIIATGAAGLPSGLEAYATRAVRPVRGMTVRVRGLDRSDQPMVRAFVRGRTFYMVSRPGGYCVLGASSDEKRDLVVEVGDLQRLLRDALDVFPSLDGAGVLETRQGLRPASSDLAPFFEIIGKRWAWSSGHYRHGVTLAPLAAEQARVFAEGLP
jgi:glycine oxidase